MRGGVERWRVGCRRAPLWKSVSQGGRIFVWSATRRCCVLQLVVAGTPLQDRRTIQSTQPKSHHLSRTSWPQITHPSVIQRAPEHSCQQRLSSYNAWAHGHNMVLLADCQHISHLWSTACVVFFAYFCVTELTFFVSTRFLQPRFPCVSGGTSRVCHWVVFLLAPLPHVRDVDGYFITDVSCEILPPTSNTISRRHWFRQVLDAHL